MASSPTALVLLDHGSRRREAHDHLEALAVAVRKHAPETCVHIAHMELHAPSLADAMLACVRDGARQVIVLPLFLAPGRHLLEDVPAQVDLASRAHAGLEIRVAEPLGRMPGLIDLILTVLGDRQRVR